MARTGRGPPLIFVLLLKASDGMELSGLVVIALENGFCAQIIIQSLFNRQDPDQNDARLVADGND